VDWLVRSFPALEFQERAPLFPTTRDLHRSAEQWFERRPPPGLDEDAWLDAREEWWSNHFLRAELDGAYLSDLAFVRDDEQLAMTWSEPWFFGDDDRIMVYPRGEFAVPWEEGRSVLTELASTVAAWLRQNDAADV
jgi:hypothetical protein